MRKKQKDDILKGYQKLKGEIVRDQVDEIFRIQPDNYISELEKTGFQYYDDDDPEEIEEKNAQPENRNLKSLILFSLDHYPARIDILSGLAFFHKFENMIATLIHYYTQACMKQMNLEAFSELAMDFYYATIPDGFEALYALRDLLDPDADKRKIIDFLIPNRRKPLFPRRFAINSR